MPTSTTKLFVGGLAWTTTESGLRDAFAKFGVLRQVAVMTDRETQRSRGFGFVEFDKPDDCQRARDAMNGASVDGRPLRVEFAEVKPRGGGERRSDAPQPPPVGKRR
jgi:RNA recognition motif-containing protein